MHSAPPLLQRRRAGVLLHPTSLPGPGAHGRLGRDARRFVDLLAASGFGVWQMLPVGPVDQSLSPYSLKCAHAGNALLVDPEEADGDHGNAGLRDFIAEHESWLMPYASYELLRRRHQRKPWWEWPPEYRDRSREAMLGLQDEPALHAILREQYLFEQQWQAFRAYARERDVTLFGDLPFYVDRDSADVWWHRHLFSVDDEGRPTEVAGVPPDYFSEDGQLWGNPLYDWQAMQEEGFSWWLQRLEVQLRRFDLLRIDHFRALESYWAVPADAPTARYGEWRPAPGAALLERLQQDMGKVPLIAEDLGTITREVRELRDEFGLPGMLVLQFAFDGSAENPYVPSRHVENAVVYTGTHDNDTTLGWYRGLDETMRQRVHAMIGGSPEAMPEPLIRVAYDSPARLAVLPLQDLLGLDSDARMNVPGVSMGNWGWRFSWAQIGDSFASHWRGYAERSSRVPRHGRSLISPSSAGEPDVGPP